MIRLTRPEQVSSVLADLRVIRRLTQRGLAAESGFRQSQIHVWEHDQRPNVASLIRLANALGYDLALIPREDA